MTLPIVIFLLLIQIAVAQEYELSECESDSVILQSITDSVNFKTFREENSKSYLDTKISKLQSTKSSECRTLRDGHKVTSSTWCEYRDMQVQKITSALEEYSAFDYAPSEKRLQQLLKDKQLTKCSKNEAQSIFDVNQWHWDTVSFDDKEDGLLQCSRMLKECITTGQTSREKSLCEKREADCVSRIIESSDAQTTIDEFLTLTQPDGDKQIDTQNSCTDKDELDIDTASWAKDSNNQIFDSCFDTYTVAEAFCNYDEVEVKEIQCLKGFICSMGKCKKVKQDECTDSDGGKDPLSAGRVKDRSGSNLHDFCTSNFNVIELTCGEDQMTQFTNIQCGVGMECIGGACKFPPSAFSRFFSRFTTSLRLLFNPEQQYIETGGAGVQTGYIISRPVEIIQE